MRSAPTTLDDATLYRILLALAGVLYPLWAVPFLLFVDGFIDDIPGRFPLSMTCASWLSIQRFIVLPS